MVAIVVTTGHWRLTMQPQAQALSGKSLGLRLVTNYAAKLVAASTLAIVNIRRKHDNYWSGHPLLAELESGIIYSPSSQLGQRGHYSLDNTVCP